MGLGRGVGGLNKMLEEREAGNTKTQEEIKMEKGKVGSVTASTDQWGSTG